MRWPSSVHLSRLGGRRATALLGGLLGLAVCAVGLLYRQPPFPSDQLNYFDMAADFPGLGETLPPHQSARIGLTGPMAVAMALFDYSQAAYLVVPILAGAALAVAVFVLGTLLVGRLVGIVAALLVVGSSLTFSDLAAPLPDLPATALFTLAVALALGVRQDRRLLTGSRRRLTATLIVIGLLLGWSYLAREFIVFGWPLVPLLLARRVGLRGLLWIALPLAVIGIGETAFNAIVRDDPLARLNLAAGHGDKLGEQTYGPEYAGHSRRWYATRLLWVLGTTPEGIWLKGALAATIAAALIWPRRLGLLLAWIVVIALPLMLLGGLLDPEQPMLRLIKTRYWFPLLPAIAVGAVAAIWLSTRAVTRWLHRKLGRSDTAGARYAAVVASVLTVAVAAVPLWTAHQPRLVDPAYEINGSTHLNEFRAWLADGGADGVDRIFSDRRTARLLAVYAHGPFGGTVWDGEFIRWGYWAEPRTPDPGELAVLYGIGSDVCPLCRAAGNDLLEEHTGTRKDADRLGELLFATDDGALRVYRLAPTRSK